MSLEIVVVVLSAEKGVNIIQEL